MRELTSHKVNGCNEMLQVIACDGPGPGGASHHYQIINVSEQNQHGDNDAVECELHFQNGAIAEAGVNGITHEVLLAVLIDRLRGFEEGPYKCFENSQALNHLREAIGWLNLRTEKRLARGVEGTMKV